MPDYCLIVRGTRLELMDIARDVARSDGNGVTTQNWPQLVLRANTDITSAI